MSTSLILPILSGANSTMTSRLLLDTCAVIWMSETPEEMTEESIAAIDAAADARVPVHVSLMTAWELSMLESRGKLPMSRSSRSAFNAFVNLPGIALSALTADILIDAPLLPELEHRDPVDRIIIATARALDLQIVTRDRRMLEYSRRGYVRALEC